MSALPTSITESHIWANTLSSRPEDEFAEARERLRSAFLAFRKRAELLAGEIRRDLPQLTLHDLAHIDALWETAATILGTNFILTPTEGFVLGGAFLLHDLGMALPAVDGGIDGLKGDPRWRDLVTYEYQVSFDREPTPSEVETPDQEIYSRVLLSLLQQTHAANAERLAFLDFSPRDSSESIHLIDDPEIRQTFGRIIGQVAHSHWWTLSELERNFQRTIGAAHWCPREWTIDPLKVACVLRCADAAQIDARRAPMFLKVLSEPSGTSDDHWKFQEKLNKPYLEEDSLVFTTGQAFRMTEASAWWLCLETLRIVDTELGAVDALFADKGFSRFSARRVAGIEDPLRLVSYIQTDGWLPINATIHVTDLPRVIKNLGGEELYGKNPTVALRELIQNATDAIRARRVYEQRQQEYGRVNVSLLRPREGFHWLEIRDDGVGMSQTVLTSFLLDFGRTFWGSPEMQREFPGLLSSGIKQIGKYGIGFFSVFMLADHVQVISRRSDAAAKDTLVLEFSSGLKGRPILREATNAEQLIDGGTLVRLRLKMDPSSPEGLLKLQYSEDSHRSLADICNELCPTLDVDLVIEEDGAESRIIKGNDWVTMDSYEFLKRVPPQYSENKIRAEDLDAFRHKAAENLRPLINETGDTIGRALITIGYASYDSHRIDLSGVVTVGGLRSCSLSGIAGVLVGMPMRASREAAKPIVEDAELKRWAEEQTALIPALWEDAKSQAACAKYVRLLGGDTQELPICRNKGAWYSAVQIRALEELPEQVIFLDEFTIDYRLEHVDSYTLFDSVFVLPFGGIPGLLQCNVRWPRNQYTNFTTSGNFILQTLGGAVLEAIAHVWMVDFKEIIESNNLEREDKIHIGSTSTGDLFERATLINKPNP